MDITYKRKKKSKAHSMAMHNVIRNEGHLDESYSLNNVKMNYRECRFLPFFMERDGVGK